MSSRKVKLGDEDISWELIYKRNKVERLKNEKDPLDVIDELPEFIDRGYENIPEDDIVRLYWWGIVHDKPKVGNFMVRLKVPCGIVTPDQLRGVGKIAEQYGDNYSELTTRMGIQLHKVELKHLPDVVEAIQETGLTNKGAEGDTVRNITGCPLTGVDPREPFNVRPVIDEVHDFFSGNPDYSDLPRKLKFTILSCPLQCSGPEFHGIALLGVLKDGREGFAVRTGGGLSSTPRISRDLRIFVPKEGALDVLRGLTDIWNEALTYRLSRPKSRIKFMVDDHGPEKIREVLEERLGRTFEDLEAPEPVAGDQSHLGLIPQKQDGLYALGYSVPQGWVMGDQLQDLGDVLDEVGGHARFTRDQNFILVDIPGDQIEWVKEQVRRIGFSFEDDNKLFGHSVACTSHKYCNYSVAKTKEKAHEILQELDEKFGDRLEEGVTFKVDGCPHACGQHWMANLGLQGTTARTEDGEKIDAYDVTLGGGLGSEVNVGKTVLRRIPTDQINDAVSRLVKVWLGKRDHKEGNGTSGAAEDGNVYSFKDFCEDHDDSWLRSVALGEHIDEVHRYGKVKLILRDRLERYAGGIREHEFKEAQVKNVNSLVKKVTRRYRSLGEKVSLENGDWTEEVRLLLNDRDVRELDGLDTSVEDGDELVVSLTS